MIDHDEGVYLCGDPACNICWLFGPMTPDLLKRATAEYHAAPLHSTGSQDRTASSAVVPDGGPDSILALLGPEWASASAIGERIGLHPLSALHRINRAIADGAPIEHRRGYGYRLLPPPLTELTPWP